MVPHTPAPPCITLATSLAGAVLSVTYLAATSLKVGPTSFLSTAWQDMQFLAVAKAWLACASGVKSDAAAQRATGRVKCLMGIFNGLLIVIGFELDIQSINTGNIWSATALLSSLKR
jgi:hypothetical protein